MRHYEIVILVTADQHERGTAMAERYRTIVADGGGTVHRFEDWGNRRLAYPIGKRMRARYFLFNIECDAGTLTTLKDDFRYSESVIRSLVLRREDAIKIESPILTEMRKSQEEAGRDDSGGYSGDAGDTAAETVAETETAATEAEPAADDGKPAADEGEPAAPPAGDEASQQENSHDEKE